MQKDKLLNLRQTINWLNANAKIGNAQIRINKRFMKMLDETGRLFPDKHTLFGRYYKLSHLKEYAHDVMPR